jgi:hypothetical protein
LTCLQGDLLLWVLAPALLHDSSHSQYIQQRSLARDTLLLDTMELREKAIAVHVHHPTKFTIDYKGPVVDIHKVWSSAIRNVDEVGLRYSSYLLLAPKSYAVVQTEFAWWAFCVIFWLPWQLAAVSLHYPVTGSILKHKHNQKHHVCTSHCLVAHVMASIW